MRKVATILLLLISSSLSAQVLKGFIVDDAGNSVSNIWVVEVYKNKKNSYKLNARDGSFEYKINHKYRFSKSGYYPTNLYISSSKYRENISLYKKPLEVVLKRYTGESHYVIDDSGERVEGVKITANLKNFKATFSDKKGNFKIPPSASKSTVFKFTKDNYFVEEIPYKDIKKHKEVIIHKMSSAKSKVKVKVLLEEGEEPIANLPVYVFAGDELDINNENTLLISETDENGAMNFIHTFRKELGEEKLGVYYDGRVDKKGKQIIDLVSKPINPRRKLNYIKLVIKKIPEEVEEVAEKKNSVVEKKNTEDIKEEEQQTAKGQSELVTEEMVTEEEVIADEDTVVEISTTHIDTLKIENKEELDQVEDYISYLEILLEENNIENKSNTGSKVEISESKKVVKEEIIDLKTEADEKEIEQEEEESKNQYLWIIILCIILILIPSVLFVVSYINHRKTKRINKELKKSNDDLANAYHRIKRNVEYAKTIQQSILVEIDTINNAFNDSFIFYRPKDIVSGDFYWFSKVGNKTIISAIDCTGHGVPGALMTIMGNSFLNEIVNVQKTTNPKLILEQLNEKIEFALGQGDEQISGGMDLSIVCIDYETKKIGFSGANNPIFYIKDDQLLEIKGVRRGVGGQSSKFIRRRAARKKVDFELHELDFSAFTQFYLFSDGYVDQFGGLDEEKFMKRSFTKLLLKNSMNTFDQQRKTLSKEIDDWKGKIPQTDDILVVGVKI